MGTSTPTRGRLIDHIAGRARSAASRNFYEAVLGSLGIPLAASEDCFWAHELFVAA